MRASAKATIAGLAVSAVAATASLFLLVDRKPPEPLAVAGPTVVPPCHVPLWAFLGTTPVYRTAQLASHPDVGLYVQMHPWSSRYWEFRVHEPTGATHRLAVPRGWQPKRAYVHDRTGDYRVEWTLWQDGEPTISGEYRWRVLSCSPTVPPITSPPQPWIFEDGFESGDTSRWSGAAGAGTGNSTPRVQFRLEAQKRA